MTQECQFADIAREYYNMVYHVVMRMCPQSSMAQDITQEIFIRIHKNLLSFNGRGKLSTWITSIAINHCIDHLRREQSLYGKLQKIFEKDWKKREYFEESVITRHLGQQILEKMSPGNRALIILKAHMDLSYKEIAQVLRISPMSVGVQLNRARAEALKIAEKVGIEYEM